MQGEAVFIEGLLDDGSPGCYRFIDHPDCAWDMEHDLAKIDRNEGCFSHGTAIDIIDATVSVETTVTSGGNPGVSLHQGVIDEPGVLSLPLPVAMRRRGRA